ncbi:MAG TPA: PH domain-containing protein [Acidimicrobiales bacterium]|nr:PH domain-containing protein [Acidimicrobiales bacterium]
MTVRDGEARVVSVTPVGRGLARPLLALVTAIVLVDYGAAHYSSVHAHRLLLGALLVGPSALLVITRVWQWRSHKIHVTSQRIVIEGGAVRHYLHSIEFMDVLATRVEQRVGERLSRRGELFVETLAGSMYVGRVRHPAALARLIDRERARRAHDLAVQGTEFNFEAVAPPGFYEPPAPTEWRSRSLSNRYRE